MTLTDEQKFAKLQQKKGKQPTYLENIKIFVLEMNVKFFSTVMFKDKIVVIVTSSGKLILNTQNKLTFGQEN